MFYSILEGPPYDLEIEDGEDGGKAVIIPIARGKDENRIVSIVCEFAEMAVEDDVYWEFSFSVDVFALDGGTEPFRTQDRNIAAKFIPTDVRDLVMRVVCAALTALVDEVGPELVYWVTKDRDPPNNSLPKHHLLKQTLENAGYSVRDEGTDRFSRRFWVMGR